VGICSVLILSGIELVIFFLVKRDDQQLRDRQGCFFTPAGLRIQT
jgi:hypothetical protein